MSRKKKYSTVELELDTLKQKLEAKEQKSWQEIQDKDLKERFSLKPLNVKQERFMTAIETGPLTIGIGCAGTGRTYLSCWMAVKFFKEGKCDKIILSRPLVDCGGEKMGFLPGNQMEKILPYFHPMIDALDEFLGEREVKDLIHHNKIIMAPIAHMRGSSFKNSFIILDEAQNCNYTQLKMALTRIGKNCTMVLSGDLSQTDLRENESGFAEIIKKIKKLEEVAIVEFTKAEIVRSGLVKRIIEVLD